MGEGTAVEQADALLIRAISAYDEVVGDPRSARPRAVAVLDEARKAGDREATVVALRAVAWSERARLRLAAARTLLDEAVRMAARHGLPRRRIEALVTRAAVAMETGATEAAKRDLARAEELTDGTAPPDLDFMRAVLLHNLGRLDDAARAYRRVLAHPDASATTGGARPTTRPSSRWCTGATPRACVCLTRPRGSPTRWARRCWRSSSTTAASCSRRSGG